MYELAKMDRKLFGKELEDYIITRMGGLSARTMKRWIKYLKELESNYYSFDYIPKINYSTLGLCQVDVNLIEPVHRDISLLIPHNYYHIILKTKEIRDAQFVQYLIPYNSMDDLYDLHEEMVDQGLISDFTFFRIFDTFHIPSPYHEVIAPEGKLKFNKEIDNSFFIKKLELSRDQVRMDEEIKKNPFIIPVIFEGDKDTFPYNKIANILLTIRREHIKRYKGVERLMREPTKFAHRVKELQIGTANSDSKFYKYIYIYYKAMFEIENTLKSQHLGNRYFK